MLTGLLCDGPFGTSTQQRPQPLGYLPLPIKYKVSYVLMPIK